MPGELGAQHRTQRWGCLVMSSAAQPDSTSSASSRPSSALPSSSPARFQLFHTLLPPGRPPRSGLGIMNVLLLEA